VSGTEDTLVQVTRSSGEPSQARANPLLLPGKMVEQYEVRETVGRGAMGVVYRARDRKLGRVVALKLCATEAEGDTCSLLCSLLVREAQTMARLSHPNLVAVYEIGEYNHCIFVAMEYVEGHSMRAWITKSSPTRGDRLRMLVDAGRGLAYAHSMGVIHRDFKPDNVLVGNGVAKVTDFGLARVLGAPIDAAGPVGACGCGTDARRLPDEATVGTPRYMSPEQFDGEAGDARSDQFSFAASAWEVLFDTLPFRAENAAQQREAINTGQIVPPPADATEAQVAALRRGLRADPAERFSDLGPLLQALT
jgi:eukaryotic-like serine/threonine-protein kinase